MNLLILDVYHVLLMKTSGSKCPELVNCIQKSELKDGHYMH